MRTLRSVISWFMPVVPESRVAVLRTVLYLFVIIDIHLFVRDPIPLSRHPELYQPLMLERLLRLPPPSVPLTITLYLILMEGRPVEEAMRQLTWRFGHIRAGKTGVLDAFFEAYLEANRKAMSLGIRHVEGLVEGEINRPVTIAPQHVALAAFSHRREAEALNSFVWIGEDVRIGLGCAFIAGAVRGVGRRARAVLEAEVEAVSWRRTGRVAL